MVFRSLRTAIYLGSVLLVISVYQSCARTSRLGATATDGSAVAPAPAPPISSSSPTSDGASVIWETDFNRTGLTLRTQASPNSGTWMPNDQTWQNPNQGYMDFAASTCSAADVTSGVCNMAGGTFDINPNDPTTTGFNPFEVANGYLTISCIRTPASMVAAVQAELTSQGITGPVPSFLGGMLLTNPNVFPGFTYGYFEFKVAFPNAGPGMFPALWFYATPGAGNNPGKGRAEIDLLEFFGHSDVFYTTVIQGNTGSANSTSVSQQAGHWPGHIDGQFHTYGMDWTADHIDFYFDRQLMYSASAAAVSWFQGVSLSPRMNYVADAAWMTSNVYLQANATTPNPLQMRVSYARLYNRKPF